MRLPICVRVVLGVLFLLFPLRMAAQEQAPWTLGDFQTQGTVSFGYRFTDINGRRQKFLELFNLQQGPRIFDFNLNGRAKEGTSPFADTFNLSLSNLGGDPFPGGQLTVRKNKLYDLRVSYRQSYYYWDRNDDITLFGGLTGLTSNHDFATVRRFGSVNLTLHATNNLRFNFEYNRTSRDGIALTTRVMEYFGSSGVWGAFLRANPYRVDLPIDELANRFTGGVDYTRRSWSFHYRLGYQTFEQNADWNNMVSPERTIDIDAAATARELLTSASFSDFRRLKTPISEFSYTGKVNQRFELRGGYIFYRYEGPVRIDAAFAGSARTNSAGTAFAPYTVSLNSRGQVTEPNHVLDQGFSWKIKDWLNLHADYRYSRFTVDSALNFHSTRDGVTAADGEEETAWRVGTHLLDLTMEFTPIHNLIFRPGIRYMKRDIEGLDEGEIDPMHTKRVKTVWPVISVFYRPNNKFSIRGDFQSMTNGASYTRISPHTDIGSRFVIRIQPIEKLSIEDNLVVRNRTFDDTAFRNNIRANALTVSYVLDDRFSVYGGFSYESYFAAASVNFIRGTPPLDVTWHDQTVNRVWQAGLAAKPFPRFGLNLSGNFVRTTGAGVISGEPPTFGPLTWPLATGTVYYDFPKVGRLSLDLQRTYYLEELVRANDFQGNLFTIRWTKDF